MCTVNHRRSGFRVGFMSNAVWKKKLLLEFSYHCSYRTFHKKLFSVVTSNF